MKNPETQVRGLTSEPCLLQCSDAKRRVGYYHCNGFWYDQTGYLLKRLAPDIAVLTWEYLNPPIDQHPRKEGILTSPECSCSQAELEGKRSLSDTEILDLMQSLYSRSVYHDWNVFMREVAQYGFRKATTVLIPTNDRTGTNETRTDGSSAPVCSALDYINSIAPPLSCEHRTETTALTELILSHRRLREQNAQRLELERKLPTWKRWVARWLGI